MIEFLLKNTLPAHFGISPDRVNVPVEKKSAPFTETDAKTCEEAAHTTYRKGSSFNKLQSLCSQCDHVVLKVDNRGKDVYVVDFETYMNSLPAKLSEGKRRCDLLMTDGLPHNKIVFCDLCCYDERLIEPNDSLNMPEGKRARARQQMAQSLEFLIGIDLLSHYILTFPERVCLFAFKSYRSPQPPTIAKRDNAEANMLAMVTSPSSVSGQIVTENNVMSHRFTFVQNKYPNVYNW